MGLWRHEEPEKMTKNTELHRTRYNGLSDTKRMTEHTTSRQTRQYSSVITDGTKKLNPRKLKVLQAMILDVKRRRGVGYRWFERFAKHRFGWYEHIGAGNFKQVRATVQDYLDVKQVYDLLREDAKIDSELLTLLLDLIQKQGEVESIMGHIITIARRHTG